MASRTLAAGKLPPELLSQLLAVPLRDAAVTLGPAPGEDACAIDVEEGTLIAATDPITLTGAEVGHYAVAINANDVAVMGARPRWFLAVVLLPPGTDESAVRALFGRMRESTGTLGAELVGGHTEVTAAVTQPLVVGQMLGWVERGRAIATGGATAGDVVLQVGEAPIEAAAVLAAEFPDTLAGLTPAIRRAAEQAVFEPGISVVAPALLAAELGATAMHDPTEGGLATGLRELALAARLRIDVTPDALLWFAPGLRVCEALGVDAWGALASGSLLACFAPERAAAALAALRGQGHPAAAIGTLSAGEPEVFASGSPLPYFERDEVARVLSD